MEPIDMTNNQPPKNGSGGTGPVIAIIVIVIVLALGGLYYLTEEVKQVNSNDTASTDQQSIDKLMSQGSSDTAAAIQADLSATDLTPVDQSVSDVDASVKNQ